MKLAEVEKSKEAFKVEQERGKAKLNKEFAAVMQGAEFNKEKLAQNNAWLQETTAFIRRKIASGHNAHTRWADQLLSWQGKLEEVIEINANIVIELAADEVDKLIEVEKMKTSSAQNQALFYLFDN